MASYVLANAWVENVISNFCGESDALKRFIFVGTYQIHDDVVYYEKFD